MPAALASSARAPARRVLCLVACAALASSRVSLAAAVAAGSDDGGDGDMEWLDDATPSPAATPLVLVPGEVVELNEHTFDSLVATGAPVLVEFYAPWCGTCKTIMPELERAAAIVANLSLRVTIARIDGPAFKAVADRYEVTSLPDFILVRGGAHEDFPTLTTAEGYVAGLGKLLDLGVDFRPVKVFPASADALEVAGWTFWRGNPEGGKLHTTTVLYSPPGLTGAAAEAAAALDAGFTGAAKELLRFSNLRFAEVNSAAVMEDFEIPTDAASIVVYKEHDEGRAVFAGTPTADGVRDFVLRHDVPLVTTVWHRNLQSFRRRVAVLALFFVTGKQAEHAPTMARLRTKLDEVAYELERKGHVRRGEFTIGIVDGKKYRSWLEHFELDMDRTPSLVVENTTTGELYAMPDFADAAVAPPVPEGYEPSPLLPADVQAAVRAEHAAAASSAPAEVGVGVDGSIASAEGGEGFEHKLDEDVLTWVDVPVAAVETWLSSFFNGGVKSHKTTEPIAASHAKVAAAVASQPRLSETTG